MKKSEMVRSLKGFLIALDATRKVRSYEEKAENILEFLEQAGMNPPTKIDMPDSYNRAEGTYGFEVNEWDSEDEHEEK